MGGAQRIMSERLSGFSIEKADTTSKYEGLRELWCRVFGDEPEFVDAFYDAFGDDITGYVICNDAGKAVSALTCFRCGVMRAADAESSGLPVYVIYAVCTDPDYRGQGLAAKLTGYVKNIVTAERGSRINIDGAPEAAGLGGISLVSPAEESLIGYYSALGYREGFSVDEHAAGKEDDTAYNVSHTGGTADNIRTWGLAADGEPGYIEDEDIEGFEPGLAAVPANGAQYNMYREAYLAGIPHVEMSDAMMEFVSLDGGPGSMLILNGGDAVCRIAYTEEHGSPEHRTVILDELLVNPMLREFSGEIDEEIASRLAEHLGADTLIYRTPGQGRCQSMYAAPEGIEIQGYFGFPIE